MSKVEFYSGTKILSMLDANGNRPEIYMVVSNRSGGKTTFFGRMLVNRFKKKGEKFILLYRYKYELDDIKTKFFNDISKLFFKRDIMTQKPILKDSIIELFINKKSCGYAICLNSADAVKKYSHIFSDVTRNSVFSTLGSCEEKTVVKQLRCSSVKVTFSASALRISFSTTSESTRTKRVFSNFCSN